MITLITGIPGSGKTLYTIDKLLRSMVGATIKHDVDGVTQDVPRRILTNINGLLLEHEKIDAAWLNEWHLKCQAGDVIVFDEVQKPWPLAATGSKVPACIEALETHRHMGVDFIVITQHPMLIHTNITRLVGRHLHVRRLGNMGLATVYEWDGCSRTLLYKNTMAKYPYRYSKAVFALYKSAEVHTKQKRKLPSLILGLGFAVVALGFFGPSVASRLSDRINPQPKAENAAKAAKPASAPASSPQVHVAAVPQAPASAPAISYVAPAGCISMAARCTCYDAAGKMMLVPEDQCRVASYRPGYLIALGTTTQPALEGQSKTVEPGQRPNGE